MDFLDDQVFWIQHTDHKLLQILPEVRFYICKKKSSMHTALSILEPLILGSVLWAKRYDFTVPAVTVVKSET